MQNAPYPAQDSQAETPSKSQRLRAMLTSPELEFLSDATTVPILVDGDTGWGKFL